MHSKTLPAQSEKMLLRKHTCKMMQIAPEEKGSFPSLFLSHLKDLILIEAWKTMESRACDWFIKRKFEKTTAIYTAWTWLAPLFTRLFCISSAFQGFPSTVQRAIHGIRFWIISPVLNIGLFSKFTFPETNIAPENRPSQKEISIPTIHFQVLC